MNEHPLRILTLADVPPDPNSGAAGTVFHTNVALRELGHDVDEIWAHDLGPRRIRHHNLHALIEQPRAYRVALRRRLAQCDYDVVQISQPQAYLAFHDLKRQRFRGLVINRSHGLELMANEIVGQWHRKLAIPETRFPRSLLSPIIQRFLRRHWHAATPHCDGILVPAKDIADFLISRLRVSPEKLAVVHHGVCSGFVTSRPRPVTPERQSRILYVGQYAFIKGPHILARTLDSILRRHSSATATWVSARTHHHLIRRLLHPATANRVSLRDWVPNEQLLNIYDEHGIFVFPSFYEGAGKACLEAMARGLCPIATDVGAMRDYITNGKSGFRVPAGDVEAFASCIDKVLTDFPLCRSMSKAARVAVRTKTWRRCAQEATAFYQRLIDLKRSAN